VNLTELAHALRDALGTRHKTDIRQAFASLVDAPSACRNGDDCAAIPDGAGYLLLAAEGLVEGFVRAEPWFAGYCAVMVNVSDVAAMGGIPTAVVDVLWFADAEHGAELLSGMRDASRAYGVPIVGGHTNARSAHAYLAVAIVGRAEKLLTSFDARPGDVLLCALDLRGAYYKAFDYWNASTPAPPERLRDDLAILAGLARDGLCRAAKDVSMAGIVGTILMLAETSGVGAAIDVDAIPIPPRVPLDRWLRTFPSYGFVLSVRPEHVDVVRNRFAARSIACAAVGTVTERRVVELVRGAERATYWDLDAEPFTGAPAHVAR
jgi:AIR synthase-related protein